MLRKITAEFECDKCGATIPLVAIDPAYKSSSEWSVFDVAEDFLRGFGVEGGVEGDKHLCKTCYAEEPRDA